MSVEKRYRSRSRSKSKDASVSDKSSERSRSRSSSRGRDRDYDTTYRLHIADIGEGVTKRELERLYEQFGGLQEIWMANSPPCFGFAVFKKKSQAVAALKSTDGLSICGSRIRVTHAKPRTRGLGRRYFNPNMRCYECGNSGHFYRDCPDLSGKYGSRSGMVMIWYGYGMVMKWYGNMVLKWYGYMVKKWFSMDWYMWYAMLQVKCVDFVHLFFSLVTH